MREVCFANDGNTCTILNSKKCGGCSFYKTEEQRKREKNKAINRILNLKENEIKYIEDKYYGGKRIFKEV